MTFEEWWEGEADSCMDWPTDKFTTDMMQSAWNASAAQFDPVVKAARDILGGGHTIGMSVTVGWAEPFVQARKALTDALDAAKEDNA